MASKERYGVRMDRGDDTETKRKIDESRQPPPKIPKSPLFGYVGISIMPARSVVHPRLVKRPSLIYQSPLLNRPTS